MLCLSVSTESALAAYLLASEKRFDGGPRWANGQRWGGAKRLPKKAAHCGPADIPLSSCFARFRVKSAVCRLGGQNEVTPCMHQATKALRPSNCMCRYSWQDRKSGQLYDNCTSCQQDSTRTVTRGAVE